MISNNSSDILDINGFKIFYKNNRSNIVNIRIIINAGSMQEMQNEHGAAHFLEHMFFKGTKFKNYKKVNQIVSKIGRTNAYTSEDTTVYYIECLNHNFSKAVEILLEMLFYPKFDINEFNKEKTVILEEYQAGLDDPCHYFFDKKDQLLWNDERSHPILGTKKDIKQMTLDKIKTFRNREYTKDNVLFSVVGDISLSSIKQTFKQNISPNEFNDRGKKHNKNININMNKRFNFHHNSTQSFLCLTFPGANCVDDIKNNYVSHILSNILSGDMHSLLWDRIREELGYCYSVGSYIDYYVDGANVFEIYCMLDQNNINKCKREILKIINKVKNKGVSKKIFDISIDNYLFDLARRFNTSSGYSRIISDKYFLNNTRLLNFQEQKKKILKLTNKDIIKYANQIFDKKKLTICTMTKRRLNNK